MGHERYSNPNNYSSTWNNSKETEEEIRRHRNRNTGYLVAENCYLTFCQDSEKGSRDLRNLVDAEPREHITTDN